MLVTSEKYFHLAPWTETKDWNCRCCYFQTPSVVHCMSSLYERNCVCAVTKIFTKFLPANNFCQLLRVTRKRSCTFGMIHRGRLELATSPIRPSLGQLFSHQGDQGAKWKFFSDVTNIYDVRWGYPSLRNFLEPWFCFTKLDLHRLRLNVFPQFES